MPPVWLNDSLEDLRRILAAYKTVAVVGLSANWHRPSFFAAKYLQQKGFRVVPVNPAYTLMVPEHLAVIQITKPRAKA